MDFGKGFGVECVVWVLDGGVIAVVVVVVVVVVFGSV